MATFPSCRVRSLWRIGALVLVCTAISASADQVRIDRNGASISGNVIGDDVLYSIGGILYALRWPDPWPGTFGYHEFFHACTAVAAICHYIAIWFAVF